MVPSSRDETRVRMGPKWFCARTRRFKDYGLNRCSGRTGTGAETPAWGCRPRLRVPATRRGSLSAWDRRLCRRNAADGTRGDEAPCLREKPPRPGSRLADGGRRPPFESAPAESFSPALPIAAKRSPNVREPRRIPFGGSRLGRPPALRSSSQEASSHLSFAIHVRGGLQIAHLHPPSLAFRSYPVLSSAPGRPRFVLASGGARGKFMTSSIEIE